VIFNSPLEVALRILVVLSKLSPKKSNLQMLIYLDYFTLYPSDSPLHEKSTIHTHTPYRGTEIAVRRQIMQEAILLLIKKGLIEKSFDRDGINYRATRAAQPFLEYFDSQYFKKYIDMADHIVSGLSQYSFDTIDQFVKDNISNWGTEFTSEALFREDNIE
jgi:hypothetical protein